LRTSCNLSESLVCVFSVLESIMPAQRNARRASSGRLEGIALKAQGLGPTAIAKSLGIGRAVLKAMLPAL
jgi:hypothetical protein